MDHPGDRRQGDRRSGEDRRVGARAGNGRRKGDRRAAALAAAGAVVMAIGMVSAPDADAQIYTRRNEHGVIEATNVPAERGYQLTYPGKGTLIHSAAWRLRPNYNGEYDHHSHPRWRGAACRCGEDDCGSDRTLLPRSRRDEPK